VAAYCKVFKGECVVMMIRPICQLLWTLVIGVGAPLLRMGWRPPGLLVPLPPLSSPAPQNPEDFHDGMQ